MTYQSPDIAEYNLRQVLKHLAAQGITRATLAGVLAALAAEFGGQQKA